MTLSGWLELIIGIGTVVAVFGVNVGWRWAPLVGLATSPAWLVATLRSGNWGMLAAAVACTFSWGIGLVRALNARDDELFAKAAQPKAVVQRGDLVSRALAKAGIRSVCGKGS